MANQLKSPATFPGTSGLLLGPNPETVTPGAFKRAVNASIRKAGIIEHRRPVALITPFGLTGYTPTTGAKSMFSYQDKLHFLANGASNVLYYFNNPGYLNTATTTIPVSTPTFDGAQMQTFKPPATAEMNGSVFMARPFAGTGQEFAFWKMDALGAAPYRAGMSPALDIGLALNGTPSGFLAISASVAYRVTYNRIDALGFLISSPPSGRATLLNTGGTASDAVVTIPIPAWVDTGVFFQLYRTATNLSGGDPGDEAQLVYQSYITAAQIVAKQVVVTDVYPTTLNMGPDLYTNQNQEGIDRANFPPPQAQHIAGFKRAMFYGNTVGKHRMTEQMLALPVEYNILAVAANTPIAGQATYTYPANSFVAGTFDSTYVLSSSLTLDIANTGSFTVVSNTANTIVVTNPGAVTTGASGLSMIGYVTNGTTRYHAGYAETFTPAPVFAFPLTPAVSFSLRIAGGARSLCKMIQTNPAETTFVAYYVSGPDDSPGMIQFEGVNFGAAYTLQGFPNMAGLNPNQFGRNWAQTIDVARNSIPQTFPSRVYFSKPGQPEHVPLASYLDVLGARSGGNQPILGLVPLRDSLFVLKRDGVYRITGDGENWAVQRYDDTLRPVCPADANGKLQSQPFGVVNNKLYVICTKGLVEITDVGSRVVSGPIDAILRGFVEGTSASTTVQEPWTTVMTNERDGLISIGIINQISSGTPTSNRALSLTYNSRLSGTTGGPMAAWPSQGMGPWTQNSLETTSANESLSLCVGLEVGGITYRMPSSGDTILPSGNIYQELMCDYTNSPSSFGELSAGSPLPGDRVTVQIVSTNPAQKQVVVKWPTSVATVRQKPSVGQLLQENDTAVLVSRVAGALYRVIAVAPAGGGNWLLTLVPFLSGVAGFGFRFSITGVAYAWTSEQCSLILEYVPFTAGNDRTSKHWYDVGVLLAAESTVTDTTIGLYTELDLATVTQAGPNVPIVDVRAVVDIAHQRSQRLSVVFTDNSVGQHTFVRGVTYTYSEDALGRNL